MDLFATPISSLPQSDINFNLQKIPKNNVKISPLGRASINNHNFELRDIVTAVSANMSSIAPL